MQEMNDEQLVDAYYLGSQEAVSELYDRYKGRLFNFSLRFSGNRADAEDATSKVFMAIVQKKYTQQSQSKFSTWAFTVARNAAISQMRKNRGLINMWLKMSDGSMMEMEIPDTSQLPADIARKKEEAARVKHFIAQLPLDQRETLVLREYHNFTYDEISQITGFTLENVKVLIFRARESLREKLAPYVKGEE